MDDRDKYANPQRFPEAAKTLACDFTDSFSRLTVCASTYLVIVTRGHEYDEVILEWAVTTPARYVGMIGSKRKVITTYEHLINRGVALHLLKRVHAPMGLDLGAVTAEEIGLSIVSQLVAVRRRKGTPIEDKSAQMEDLLNRLEVRGSLRT